MNIMSHWGQPVALISLLLVAVGDMNAPATAVSADVKPVTVQDGNSFQIAQAENLCRLVNVRQGLVVRERPDPNSRAIAGVGFNSQITFVQGYRSIPGPDGRLWIEISAPQKGYISSGFPNSQTNIIPCSGTVGTVPPTYPPLESTNPPPTTVSLCRQVSPRSAPQGLSIRADTSRLSTYVGGVPANGQVTLISGYRVVPDKNGEGRNWVQITAPMAGYVSANNLIMCR